MTDPEITDQTFIETRWRIEGDPLQNPQGLLAAALVREAALALLVQGKAATKEGIIQFAAEVAGNAMMEDKLLARGIQVFAARLTEGPFQAGPDHR